MAAMQAGRPRDEEDDAGPVRRAGLIPRQLLDEHAVFVVKRLQREGHEAYLVGGCVRDLLAGLEPKDFDVATDAHPNRIKRLFRSARVIGRRFRLVHVRFPGDAVIETATFRGDPAQHESAGDDADTDRRDWRTSAENIFGTASEDAMRRDFTVNALFYDPVADEVIDWVGGLEDLRKGVIRCIGDPPERIHEDPVRMLRAVHFAQRMDFAMEPSLEAAIREHARVLEDASQARLYVELVKMLTRGRARGTFHTLHRLGVLHIWLPELTAYMEEPADWPEQGGGTHEEAQRGEPADIPVGHATWNLLGAADHWGLAAHDAPESLGLCVLFGPWLLRSWRRSGLRGFHGFVDHLEETFRPVAVRMSIPRWAAHQMRDILWLLDELRQPPQMKKARRLVRRPGFAAALAFLELDLRARAASSEPADAWRNLAEKESVRLVLGKPPPASAPRRRGAERPAGGRRRGGRGPRRGKRRGGDRTPTRDITPAPEAGAWLEPPEA